MNEEIQAEKIEEVADLEIDNQELVENTSVEEEVQTEEVNEAEFTDGKPQQTKEENAEFARRRREAERQKAIEEAYERGKREAENKAFIGLKNHFTGEPITDKADALEYRNMLAIEAEGLDPIADYAKWQKKQLREQETAKSAKQKQEEWINNDRKKFTEDYPDVDLEALIKDTKFGKFARGKVGTIPLSEIYADFVELVGEFEKGAEKKAQKLLANAKASPGALGGAAKPNIVNFATMSDKQFQEYLERAKRGEFKKS